MHYKILKLAIYGISFSVGEDIHVFERLGLELTLKKDMFNEVQPKSNDPKFLAETAKNVRNSLREDAVWVMQGWLFHETPQFWQPEQVKAFLQGVPIGELLVLDLYAENSPIFNVTDSFYGQPYIWCMLGNFGGNTGWFGALPDIQV